MSTAAGRCQPRDDCDGPAAAVSLAWGAHAAVVHSRKDEEWAKLGRRYVRRDVLVLDDLLSGSLSRE